MTDTALIIGCGSIGSRHAHILSQMEYFNSVSVFSSQKGLPFKTLTSFNEIIELNPDYIVIASNTTLHYKFLLWLEENFTGKSILVEKPLFDKPYDLQINNNNVFIGYNLRFHPIINQIKNICEGKKLWSLSANCGSYLPDWRPNRDYRSTASATKSTGGGVLLDLSHELDYIQWIAGEINPNHVFNEKLSNLKINTDDFLMLNGETPSGCKVHIGLNYFTRKPIRQILINGENISITADLIKNKMTVHRDNNYYEYAFPEYERDFTYLAQHQAILRGDFSTVSSFAEGFKIMELINKINCF